MVSKTDGIENNVLGLMLGNLGGATPGMVDSTIIGTAN